MRAGIGGGASRRGKAAGEERGVITAVDLAPDDAARPTFEEGVKGSSEPGKLADLAVPEDEIKDIQVDLTMVGCRIVYERPVA